jgi:hypothetical protein
VESNFPMPARQPPPEGTVLELVMNRLTGEVVASHLGDTPTTTLAGAVERESIKTSSAQIARLRQRRAKAGRARARGRHGAHTASWAGGKCNGENGYEHCYAIANWQMEKGSEKVIGSHFQVDLWEAYAPTGGEQFVDEEEWVGASPEDPGGWLEAGLISRAGVSGLWWFWAWKNGGGPLNKFLGPGYTSEEPANAWDTLGFSSVGGDTWCVMIGPYSETEYYCMDPGYIYSKELEDGSEMATDSAPIVHGFAESNYTALNGEARNWNKAINETKNWSDESVTGLCIHDNWRHLAGDIVDGTAGTDCTE